MNEPELDNLRAVWRQLAPRNDWALVADEGEFLRQALGELTALGANGPPNQRARLAVLRAYGALLHQGLLDRHDRAAYELWLACYRLALRDGAPPPEAELLAQETIARVIEKLGTLRSPQSLLAWALRIFRTARGALAERADAPESLDAEQPAMAELAHAVDMIAAVEQHLIGQELLAMLRAKLPNELERIVLLRVVALGDRPRDVAHDLGLPLHRARLAKSRALQRLRGDHELLQFLGELAHTGAQPLPTAGGDDDDS